MYVYTHITCPGVADGNLCQALCALTVVQSAVLIEHACTQMNRI